MSSRRRRFSRSPVVAFLACRGRIERDRGVPRRRQTRPLRVTRLDVLAVSPCACNRQMPRILVDGERWATPEGQDRIGIQLSEGRHHIEVRKDGFTPYVEDVLIRRGATFTLNVSLSKGQ